MKIVVIDYDSGNLRSVDRALESHGVSPIVTADPAQIADADAVIFPGVGSGPAAMDAIEKRSLVEPLRSYVASGRPFLGICLGLQLLHDSTEEGPRDCLGIIPGMTRRLPQGLKVPHMGWNSVHQEKEHPVLEGIPQDSYFYFVHSYYAEPLDASGIVGVTEYGVNFCSIYAKDNLVATQFHPEKSGDLGLRIYGNFIRMAAASSIAGSLPNQTA